MDRNVEGLREPAPKEQVLRHLDDLLDALDRGATPPATLRVRAAPACADPLAKHGRRPRRKAAPIETVAAVLGGDTTTATLG